jgi:DNA modification methylase
MIVIYGSFHDFTRRAEWLSNAKRYLKPGGTLAIIDGYHPGHGALTKDVVVELGVGAGYRLVFYKDCSREYVGEDGGKGFYSNHVHILARD